MTSDASKSGDTVKAPGRINVSVAEGVGRVELDNPAKLNAISGAMWRTLVEALAVFEEDPALRCVIITGQGDKAFCTGADIGEKDAPQPPGGNSNPAADEALQRIRTFSKPTIAMIRGYCLGGGVALAAACDLRIAATGSRFGLPAAKLGLPPLYPVLKRLTDLVGPANAKRILFTADRFSAEEALRFGLVDELVPAEELSTVTQEWAARIAANAPLTIAAVKYAIEAIVDEAAGDVEGYMAFEHRCMESQDYVEGRRAFKEKRAPLFQGR